jgi:hypothetical protein
MAAAVVKAADALWDAQGGHDPTVAAAMTQRSRSSAPANRKKSDKRCGNNCSKSRPPFRPDSYSWQGVCKFHNYYAHKASGVFHPILGQKTKKPPDPYRFGGNINKKTVQFQGKLFSSQFLQDAVADHILGIDFLRRFKVTVALETSQIFFACIAAAPSTPQSFLPSFDCTVALVSLPAGTASLPAASPDCVHQVKPASFHCQGNKSIRDPPSPSLLVLGPNQMQPIPDSVPTDVKILLQKFPSILRTGDVKGTPNHGVEHHIHTDSHPPIFVKSHRLDPEKLKLPKQNSKGWNPLA